MGLVLLFIVVLAMILLFVVFAAGSVPTQTRAQETIDVPEPIFGEFEGLQYSAESLDMETVTIGFSLDSSLSQTAEINAREGEPEGVPPELAGEVDALLELGATYIDVGYNTDRVAAEVPFEDRTIDRQFVEEVLTYLKRILDRYC